MNIENFISSRLPSSRISLTREAAESYSFSLLTYFPRHDVVFSKKKIKIQREKERQKNEWAKASKNN